jgi:hypothetical protein
LCFGLIKTNLRPFGCLDAATIDDPKRFPEAYTSINKPVFYVSRLPRARALESLEGMVEGKSNLAEEEGFEPPRAFRL